MLANTDNALLFLVSSLSDLVLAALLVRILLQLSRAEFYNPISQLVWKLSKPVVDPVARFVPRWKRLDSACALVLLVASMIFVELVSGILDLRIPLGESFAFAVLKVVSLALGVYTLSLFAQAILSWVGPGVSNPASNVLWSLNEPLLRPVRRILPPVSGLDLSPIPVMLLLQVFDRLLPLPGVFH
jgi:YggT family protein